MCIRTKNAKRLIALMAAVVAATVIGTAGMTTVYAANASGSVYVLASGGGQSEGIGVGVITADRLNVRTEPGLDAKIVDVVLKGETVTLLGRQKDWYKISRNGRERWINADYVRLVTEEPAPSETTAPQDTTAAPTETEATAEKSTAATTSTTAKKTTTTAKKTTTTTTAKKTTTTLRLESCRITASYLYLRSGPGMKYEIIGGLEYGKTAKVLEKKGSWIRVSYSGKTGWMSSSYVKFISDAEATTAATKKVTTTAKTTAATTKKTATTTAKKTTTTTKATTAATSKATTTAKKTTTTTEKTTTTAKKTTTTTKAGNSASGKSVAATGKVIIKADLLNARADASITSKKVGTVRRNEVYSYTAIKDGWYKVVIPSGKTAYISGEYTKKFTSYAIDGGGSYLWPTQTATRISSYFGPRDSRNHCGIDIAAPGGSQILAVAPGRVIRNNYEGGGFGYYIVIQQNDGVLAYYGHMQSRSYVKVGTTVKTGDQIGIVGSTGHSTGNHLHLEFRRGSARINPLHYYPNFA